MRWSRPSASSSYQRVADIASGGVGHVELVVRRGGSFERLYARKRLHAAHRDDPDFRTMFFDEARIAGLVSHPNVVSVLDVGEDDEGPFLVMDYVEGVSVAAIIRRAIEARSPVPLQLALHIGIETARGLHAAHELVGPDGQSLALVHRDVSPQNVLVGFDGITRVTDFGVAKAFGRSTRTQAGVLKGKLGYMAPEQLRFEEIDRRADLFALGVVLFELFAGRRLYRNVEDHDGVRRILHEPPPDLGDARADAAPELVEVVFSMLAKDPVHRPASALEVARVLEEVLIETVQAEGRTDPAEQLAEMFGAEIEAQRARARVRPVALAAARPRGAMILAGVALGVIAVGVAWASLSTETAPASQELETVLAPRAAPPVVAPEVTGVAEPDDEALTSAPAVEPTREPRRPRRRASRPSSDGHAKVPVWDWQ